MKMFYLLFFCCLSVLLVWSVNAAEQTIKDPVIGSKGYYVGSYGGGAYWVTDGLWNSMFVVSDKGSILVANHQPGKSAQMISLPKD